MAAAKRDIPDLDIPDLGPSPPSRAPAPRESLPVSPSRDLDPDDDFQHGSGIELGTGGSLRGGYGDVALDAGPAFGGIGLGGGFDPDFDELEGSNAAAVPTAAIYAEERRRVWPTGETVEPDPRSIDTRDVAAIAAYGPPPGNALLAPIYSVRVFLRRRVLRELVKASALELEAKERARDELLGRLAEDLRGEMATRESTQRLLPELDKADARLAERRAELAGSNADYAGQLRILEKTAADIDVRIREAQAIVEQRERVLEEQQNAQRRLEAKEKRLFIELRPIADAAQRKDAALSPAQHAKAREIEDHLGALKPQLERARASTHAALGAREAARRKLAQCEGERTELARRRRTVDASFAEDIGQQSKALEGAEAERRVAFATAARHLLRMRGAFPVPAERLDASAAADGEVNAQALTHARNLRALDDYDPDAFKRGGVVLAVGCVAILLLIVLAV